MRCDANVSNLVSAAVSRQRSLPCAPRWRPALPAGAADVYGLMFTGCGALLARRGVGAQPSR